jgi:hypothetical protein
MVSQCHPVHHQSHAICTQRVTVTNWRSLWRDPTGIAVTVFGGGACVSQKHTAFDYWPSQHQKRRSILLDRCSRVRYIGSPVWRQGLQEYRNNQTRPDETPAGGALHPRHANDLARAYTHTHTHISYVTCVAIWRAAFNVATKLSTGTELWIFAAYFKHRIQSNVATVMDQNYPRWTTPNPNNQVQKIHTANLIFCRNIYTHVLARSSFNSTPGVLFISQIAKRFWIKFSNWGGGGCGEGPRGRR